MHACLPLAILYNPWKSIATEKDTADQRPPDPTDNSVSLCQSCRMSAHTLEPVQQCQQFLEREERESAQRQSSASYHIAPPVGSRPLAKQQLKHCHSCWYMDLYTCVRSLTDRADAESKKSRPHLAARLRNCSGNGLGSFTCAYCVCTWFARPPFDDVGSRDLQLTVHRNDAK